MKDQERNQLLANGEGKDSLLKVLTIKTTKHSYYVQRMPGHCGLGVRYRVMKDRKMLFWRDYDTEQQACEALIRYVYGVVTQTSLDLF